MLKPFEDMEDHPLVKTLTEAIIAKTGTNNPNFYTVMVSSHLVQIASTMRTYINSAIGTGLIPVNMYAICLAKSGTNKGLTMSLLEDKVTNQFREKFLNEIFNEQAKVNLRHLAQKRALINGTTTTDEYSNIFKEFKTLGNIAYSFDSGTTPALKQLRYKLQLANIGSLNFIMDELGNNLLNNTDVFSTFLELFDGKIKQKLIKETKDSQRGEDLNTKTPTNMLLFGTETAIFDGGRKEAELLTMLETGYARRCIIGYGEEDSYGCNMTSEQIYEQLTNVNLANVFSEASYKLGLLADAKYSNTIINVPKSVDLLIIEYRQQCEIIASSLPEHDFIRKAEIKHRFFKTLKVAAGFSFIDGESTLHENNLYAAIKMSEISGKCFARLLTRERNYVKLAKFISNNGNGITEVDLVEELPFYKGTIANKKDLMALAKDWGYKNNIVIKDSYIENIRVYSGESLKENDLSALILSYSKDMYSNYEHQEAPFKKLHILTSKEDLYWINHHIINGIPNIENIIPSTNTIIIDISNISLNDITLLLSSYTYHLYSNEDNTKKILVLPLSHTIKLSNNDYVSLVTRIHEWLPFDIESNKSSNTIWNTECGSYKYNIGKLIDVFMFIPRTTRYTKYMNKLSKLKEYSYIEKWFMLNILEEGIENVLLTYSKLLQNWEIDFISIGDLLIKFNNKAPNKLSDEELNLIINTGTLNND